MVFENISKCWRGKDHKNQLKWKSYFSKIFSEKNEQNRSRNHGEIADFVDIFFSPLKKYKTGVESIPLSPRRLLIWFSEDQNIKRRRLFNLQILLKIQCKITIFRACGANTPRKIFACGAKKATVIFAQCWHSKNKNATVIYLQKPLRLG